MENSNVKKFNWSTVLVAIVLSLLFSALFGRFLLAKISTLPILNRWKIISPQAPIVIHTKEEVRISDGGDVLNAINAAKSKISSVVRVEAEQVTYLGGAINVTSEGLFVTPGSVFTTEQKNIFVLLNDGRRAEVTSSVLDPATDLAFFSAKINNVPVGALSNSAALNSGEKILFLASSPQNFQTKYLSSFVSFSQKDILNQVFDADRPSRSFGSQAVSPLAPGQAVVNLHGEIVGIWSGSNIISSDVLKGGFNLYISNQQKIARPSFGFSYTVVTKTDFALLNLVEGARIKSMIAASPAAKAGLLEKDIITEINGEKINEEFLPEESLAKYKPGDKLTLNVTRGSEKISLSLTVGELK